LKNALARGTPVDNSKRYCMQIQYITTNGVIDKGAEGQTAPVSS